MGAMDRGLRERVRWGNVALALAVPCVLALVVAWPLLAPGAPAGPAPHGVPVATPRAAPPAVRPRKPVEVPRERRAGEGGGGSRPRRRKPRARVTPAPRRATPPVATATAAPVAPPAPVATAVPVAPPAPAPADPDPVLREFGPESG